MHPKTHLLSWSPSAQGQVCGLGLAGEPMEELVRLYVATLVGLALGTRRIIEEMNASGHNISSVYACGGLSKNRLYLQAHADALQMPVVLAQEADSVRDALIAAKITVTPPSHGGLGTPIAAEARHLTGASWVACGRCLSVLRC